MHVVAVSKCAARLKVGLFNMRTSRGMGDISPTKMPKKKVIRRKDNPDEVDMYKKGGKINLPSRKQRNK